MFVVCIICYCIRNKDIVMLQWDLFQLPADLVVTVFGINCPDFM